MLGRQQGQVEFASQLKPRGRMGVHALAQSRGRRHHANIQRTGEELVTPKCFDRIEVIFALRQQAQVGLQNIAVGDAAHAGREFAVNALADFQALGVLPHQGQSGIGGEVVGQFFDIEVSHAKFTFRVNRTCGLSR